MENGTEYNVLDYMYSQPQDSEEYKLTYTLHEWWYLNCNSGKRWVRVCEKRMSTTSWQSIF